MGGTFLRVFVADLKKMLIYWRYLFLESVLDLKWMYEILVYFISFAGV
jgi:hypothetical protein